MSGITLGNLRDWHLCLDGIRDRMRFAHTEAMAHRGQANAGGIAADDWDKTNLAIAEGMLSTVVRQPQHSEASLQLDQFATALSVIQPELVPAGASKLAGTAYEELWDGYSAIQRGLPAIVETFSLYAEGRYRLDKTVDELIDELDASLSAEPRIALALVGEIGCLCLRGLIEVDDLPLGEGFLRKYGVVADWLDAVAGVVDCLVKELEDYPLSEIELVRDRWQTPDDEARVQYRIAKLTRLGVVEPEVQALLLPLLSPDVPPQSLVTAKAAIARAGSVVVPGLIAIASDVNSRVESSISEGEAAIRAVELLRTLRATDAVPAFLQILQTTDWTEEIHEQVIQALEGEMLDVAFPAALEAFDGTTDADLRNELGGILAKGGRDKQGVFERLIGHFRAVQSDRDAIAGYLAELGDPRALPDLHQELRRTNDWTASVELEAAIIELGGELTAAEKRKLLQLESSQIGRLTKGLPPVDTPDVAPMIDWLSQLGGNDIELPIDAPAKAPVTNRVPKVGRNDPCPCGSGKKYKKCHGR